MQQALNLKNLQQRYAIFYVTLTVNTFIHGMTILVFVRALKAKHTKHCNLTRSFIFHELFSRSFVDGPDYIQFAVNDGMFQCLL